MGDVPTPQTPPKMFVNTDTEQEELVLVVYKVWPFKGGTVLYFQWAIFPSILAAKMSYSDLTNKLLMV